jgi:hypothetical protein
MAEPKTQKSRASVPAFIAAVANETRRKDAKVIDKLMREITGEKPAMWGPTIVGYGEFQTPSGKWPRIGFSPRKASMVLYVMGDFKGRAALMKKLGKHKTGVACLYINSLADVDAAVLRQVVQASWDHMNEKYG